MSCSVYVLGALLHDVNIARDSACPGVLLTIGDFRRRAEEI